MATRMRTDTMLPIAEKIDQVGFFSLEMWGGATFDVAIRFLAEDPWERIRILKRQIKRTPFQMLPADKTSLAIGIIQTMLW